MYFSQKWCKIIVLITLIIVKNSYELEKKILIWKEKRCDFFITSIDQSNKIIIQNDSLVNTTLKLEFHNFQKEVIRFGHFDVRNNNIFVPKR